MNNHSKRLVNRIYKSFINYENEIIDETGLLRNVEGNLGAIEEKDVYEVINKIVVTIEDARWIYDSGKGRNLILEEKDKILLMLEP